jgi:hypothetical protein
MELQTDDFKEQLKLLKEIQETIEEIDQCPFKLPDVDDLKERLKLLTEIFKQTGRCKCLRI